MPYITFVHHGIDVFQHPVTLKHPITCYATVLHSSQYIYCRVLSQGSVELWVGGCEKADNMLQDAKHCREDRR